MVIRNFYLFPQKKTHTSICTPPPKTNMTMGETTMNEDVFHLGGGFKYSVFSSLFEKDSHFDEYFSIWLKPPTRDVAH